jgi:hypothetical protein
VGDRIKVPGCSSCSRAKTTLSSSQTAMTEGYPRKP